MPGRRAPARIDAARPRGPVSRQGRRRSPPRFPGCKAFATVDVKQTGQPGARETFFPTRRRRARPARAVRRRAATGAPVSPAAYSERRDLAGCRAMLRHGSRTFYAASFLLPRPVREPASALYAFCRLADDAVDLSDDPAPRLAELRQRLDAVYAARPVDHPADRAFAHVVRRFAVPRELPDALLEGLEWDADGRRYADLPGLRAYAMRVAGTVGAMMALLMGARRPASLARACDLGAAMQLTNIARDVGEDARAGRLYLPTDWLCEAGLDPDAWLARPQWTPELGAVVRRLLDAAETLYARAADGIADLPPGCRPGINAARLLYREIGLEVARGGFDSVSRRAVVPARRKVQVLLRAVAEVTPPGAGLVRAGAVTGTGADGSAVGVGEAGASPRAGIAERRAGRARAAADAGALSAGPARGAPAPCAAARRVAVHRAAAALCRPALVVHPPLPEAGFLVDAVRRAAPPAHPRPWWNGALLPGLDRRIDGVLDLIERLERRDRVARLAPARRAIP